MNHLITLLIAPSLCFGQVITTIAGNGTQGFSGDGTAATNATLYHPQSVVIDNNSNIFITDSKNYVIRRVNAGGIISTVAGTAGVANFSGDGGSPTAAQMEELGGITLDYNNQLLFCDRMNGRIRKVIIGNTISTVAGNGWTNCQGDGSQATFSLTAIGLPWDVYGDAAGNFYIATACPSVRKVDVSGVISTVAGNNTIGYSGDNGPATQAQLSLPTGVCFDNSGNMYIADAMANAVRKVDNAGIITTIAGDGTNGNTGDGGLSVNSKITPYDIIADGNNNLYISCWASIRKIDTNGIITTIAGTGTAGYSGDGGPASSAELNGAWGLAFDNSGSLVFADRDNNVVRKITNVNGLNEHSHSSVVVNITYFDILGRPIQMPEGMCIEIRTYTDGRKEVKKVFIK